MLYFDLLGSIIPNISNTNDNIVILLFLYMCSPRFVKKKPTFQWVLISIFDKNLPTCTVVQNNPPANSAC